MVIDSVAYGSLTCAVHLNKWQGSLYLIADDYQFLASLFATQVNVVR